MNGQIPNSASLITNDPGLTVELARPFPREDDIVKITTNEVDSQSSQSKIRLGTNTRQRDSFQEGLEILGFICTSIVDDDDFDEGDNFNGNQWDRLDGDTQEDVTGLDRSLLTAESDDRSTNVFADAYVRILYDFPKNHYQTNADFYLNTPGQYKGEAGAVGNPDLLTTYRFDNRNSENDRLYWTIYLFGAYQGWTEVDADPSTETILVGIVDLYGGGKGANVFLEIDRKGEVKENFGSNQNRAITAAHEIGHLFGGDHGDKGIMAAGTDQENRSRRFKKETLRTIRTRRNP